MSWRGGAKLSSVEWEWVKVPWIRPPGLSSSVPTPSFAPGFDLPEATLPMPLTSAPPPPLVGASEVFGDRSVQNQRC